MSEGQRRFQRIYIEIGNVCNLQCSFCPAVERQKQSLQDNQLLEILKKIKAHTEQICFHVMGEPLAHPNFSQFVQIAADMQIPLEITTNGTLLNPQNQQSLLSPIVRQVNFSLQSFFDNFPSSDPNTYTQKIFAFTKLAMIERPDLYLNFRLWNMQPEEKEDKINLWLHKQIENEFEVLVNPRIDTRLIKSKKLLGRLYLHYDTRFVWPNPKDPILRQKGTCHGTRTHIAIHADGKVVPCCLDKEANIVLGNVLEEDFAAILTSERLENMRRGFENKQLVEDLCQRCQYALRFG